MKNILFAFSIMVLFSTSSYSQNDSLIHKDFVLVVNDEIRSSVGNLQFFAYENGKRVDYYISYHVGNLSFQKKEYSKLINENIDSTYLEFDYHMYEGEKHTIRHFVINFPIDWTQNTYMILYLYDLKNKKYRNLFKTSKTETHIIEFESSRGAMKRIRKR